MFAEEHVSCAGKQGTQKMHPGFLKIFLKLSESIYIHTYVHTCIHTCVSHLHTHTYIYRVEGRHGSSTTRTRHAHAHSAHRIRLPRLRFWGSVPLRKAPGCVGSFVMCPVSWETSAATAFLSPVLDTLESTSTATSCTLGSLSCKCLIAGGGGQRPSEAPRGYFQEPARGLPYHGTARQTVQRTGQNDTLTNRSIQTRLGAPDHVQLGASHPIVRRTGQRRADLLLLIQTQKCVACPAKTASKTRLGTAHAQTRGTRTPCSTDHTGLRTGADGDGAPDWGAACHKAQRFRTAGGALFLPQRPRDHADHVLRGVKSPLADAVHVDAACANVQLSGTKSAYFLVTGTRGRSRERAPEMQHILNLVLVRGPRARPHASHIVSPSLVRATCSWGSQPGSVGFLDFFGIFSEKTEIQIS